MTAITANPACPACGRRAVTTTTLCTGRVITTCRWCGDERVASGQNPIPAAGSVSELVPTDKLFDLVPDGGLF